MHFSCVAFGKRETERIKTSHICNCIQLKCCAFVGRAAYDLYCRKGEFGARNYRQIIYYILCVCALRARCNKVIFSFERAFCGQDSISIDMWRVCVCLCDLARKFDRNKCAPHIQRSVTDPFTDSHKPFMMLAFFYELVWWCCTKITPKWQP